MLDNDELRLNGLIDEAHRLAERVRDGTSAVDNLNNLGVAILAATIGVGLGTDRNLVFLVAPVVGLLLLVHAVQTFTELLGMAGHRRFLESYLSEQLGRPFLCHETTIGLDRGRALDLRLKQALYATVLIAVTGVVWNIVRTEGERWLLAVYSLFVLFAGIALSMSVVAMLKASDRAFDLVKAYYDEAANSTPE